MTEEQIERKVEKMIDRLDWRLMNDPDMDQDTYNVAMFAITEWANGQYDQIKPKTGD